MIGLKDAGLASSAVLAVVGACLALLHLAHRPYTISADPAGQPLIRGAGAVRLDPVVHNPGPLPVLVGRITVQVSGTSAGNRCGPAWFRVTPYRGAAFTVGPGQTASLSRLGVVRSRWPSVRLVTAATPAGCQGVTVSLRFHGSGPGLP